MLALLWAVAPLARAAVPQQGFRATSLGPGSFEPAEWASYPRGEAVLDEAHAAMARAWDDGVARQHVCLGGRDLTFLAPPGAEEAWLDELSVSAAVELAARWDKGPRRILTTTTAAAREAARRCGRRDIAVDTLGSAAAAGSDALRSDSLVVVARPDSYAAAHRRTGANPVTQLQIVATRLRRAAALVVLNPQLALPSPFAPGRTMPPFLLRDFEPVYVAQADAFDAVDDSGLALYFKRPHPTWRLYERKRSHFAFVGSVPHRPDDAQLRTVYRAATQDDDDDDVDV